MTATSETANVLKALERNALLPSQVSFNSVVLHRGAELLDIIVRQILCPDVRANPGGGQNLLGPNKADAIDVGQGDFDPLVPGNIDAGNPCQDEVLLKKNVVVETEIAKPWCGAQVPSALSLLVFGIDANHHYPPMAADDPTPLAHLLDRSANFHGLPSNVTKAKRKF